MEKIKDIFITRFLTGVDGVGSFGGYIHVNAKFILDLPAPLVGVPNIQTIAESYAQIFGIEKVENNKVYFSAKVHTDVFKPDGTGLVDEQYLQNLLLAEYTIYEQRLSAFSLLPFDQIIGKSWDGASWS